MNQMSKAGKNMGNAFSKPITSAIRNIYLKDHGKEEIIEHQQTIKRLRLTKKIKKGIADEKDGAKYYSSFTPKQKRKIGETGTKHLQDAKKDEKEHLGFLQQDLEHINPKRKRP